jgi:hypothetical protein
VQSAGTALAAHPLTTSLDYPLPLLRLDPTLTEQAIVNLLVNAGTHTPPGTPVELRARVEGPDLLLTIADRGPGLPPGDPARRFDPVRRAPDAPTGGAGLGLSIVRGFIEAQGGRVEAANRPGGGASLTLLRQTSASSFTATSITVADGARRLAIADLNGDGLADVAVVSLVYQAQNLPSRITVLLQSAASRGVLVPGGVYDGPYSGNFIAIGDLNADGLNDIAVNDGPVVLLQRAASLGTFEPPRPLR